MGCFRNPIVVSGSVLCNILYCIVESFSLIRGRRYGWPNHVKTSCTVCVFVLSLCSWTNIVGIKAFASITKPKYKINFPGEKPTQLYPSWYTNGHVIHKYDEWEKGWRHWISLYPCLLKENQYSIFYTLIINWLKARLENFLNLLCFW